MTFFSIFLGMTHVIHGHSMIFNAYGGTSAVTSQMLRHLRFQAEVMVQAVANQWMVYGYVDTAELMFSRKWNQQINGLVSWFRWLGTFWKIPPGVFSFFPPTMEVVGELSLQHPSTSSGTNLTWWMMDLGRYQKSLASLGTTSPGKSHIFPRFLAQPRRLGSPSTSPGARCCRAMAFMAGCCSSSWEFKHGGWILTGRTSGHQRN